MPKVGIHIDPGKQFVDYLKRYEIILKENGIDVIRMDSNDPKFWDQIKELDAFICRWSHYDVYRQRAKAILPVVEEHYQVKCFPNNKTAWHYDDKIRQYYLTKAYGYPMIDSYIFWDRYAAIDWSKSADLPIIFKLIGGAGSQNVILIKTRSELRSIIKTMFLKGVKDRHVPSSNTVAPGLIYQFKYWLYNKINSAKKKDVSYWRLFPNWLKHKNYVYFQKYLPENSFDIRITTIGNRAFAFRRHVRKKDFRASGSGKIDYDMNQIDTNCVKIALKVSKEQGFQTMAYDFLYDENKKPQFCEISYTYMDSAVYNCPGYWDDELNWHEGHYWPQYYHLVDLLENPDLIQPDLLNV